MCLQVHGMPRVLGVLNHLDCIPNPVTQKNIKKTLKRRFWDEVYRVCRMQHSISFGPTSWGSMEGWPVITIIIRRCVVSGLQDVLHDEDGAREVPETWSVQFVQVNILYIYDLSFVHERLLEFRGFYTLEESITLQLAIVLIIQVHQPDEDPSDAVEGQSSVRALRPFRGHHGPWGTATSSLSFD